MFFVCRICMVFLIVFFFFLNLLGPRVDNFQTLDPRKQELLEARFLGMRSTSNPAGTGSGGGGNSNNSNNLLQAAASSLQHHQSSMVQSASCNNLMTGTSPQVQQQHQHQPSPSSGLNASGGPPTQFAPASYSAPASNHGEHGTYKEEPYKKLGYSLFIIMWFV